MKMMTSIGRFLAIGVCALVIPSCGSSKTAGRDNSTKPLNGNYLNYINRYADLAVRNMHQYHIPASITLAQGLLESNAGQSPLATKANNHFGIKCGTTWSGPSVSYDDDAPGECFRSYQSPEASYRDHSLFLTSRSRYSFLFDYSVKDYKKWAHGLKKAGYATNPKYAHSLIKLIEQYDLHRYDSSIPKYGDYRLKYDLSPEAQIVQSVNVPTFTHRILMNNGLYYVVARKGDTFESLSKELDISVRKLVKYNELFKEYQLKEGDILYLSEKRKKADKRVTERYHTILAGESIYTIAQKFGVRMESLYKMNNADPTYYAAKQGERIRIR